MNTYRLLRSKRRSIALIITNTGELEVRAGLKTAIKVIEAFINTKLAWITKKQELMIKNPKVLPKEYIDGEEFLYEGNMYKLQYSDCSYISIDEYLFVPKNFSFQVKKSLTYWYQAQALAKITERIKYYTGIANLTYKAIKLTNAQRIWGSCTHDGVLRVNWRLIMAPTKIMDYVIVHEVAHLVEHNHSKNFWRKVEVLLPDYKERRVWLKQNSELLIM